jgi:hypothetical protein
MTENRERNRITVTTLHYKECSKTCFIPVFVNSNSTDIRPSHPERLPARLLAGDPDIKPRHFGDYSNSGRWIRRQPP